VQSVPGIRVGQAGVGGSGQLDGLLGEQRIEQLALVREPSVRGTDPNTRVSSDVVKSDLEALLSKELPGRGQQPLPVLYSVPAHGSWLPRRGDLGHPLTLPDTERQSPDQVLRSAYPEMSTPLMER